MRHDRPRGSSSFRPPSWLKNPHFQTIYAACVAPLPRVAFRRERWETPDADFLDLDWLVPARSSHLATTMQDDPLVILFHGLEGSSRSHYARTIMKAVDRRGWHGVVVHFRGCGGEPNRLPRAYHSGDTVEMDWILERFRSQWRGPICAVAISLGANVLLKWLGERGEAARNRLSGACAVSTPMDLVAAGHALDQGFNRFYTWNFLRTLRRKTMAKLVCHRGLLAIEHDQLRSARTLRAFDDQVTSRMHGFRDAMDYWTRSSSKPWLQHIAVPTLVLNARDDPFLPASALPAPTEASPAVTLEFPDHGGHVGFVTGCFPGSLAWLPQRLLDFLDDCLTSRRSATDGMA